jgi:RNA polymerase sigma factor FliA
MLAIELTKKRSLNRVRATRTTRVVNRTSRRVADRGETETELINKHLPLVKTVVGRIQMSLPPQVDPEDLHSAGMLGLLDAIRHYNPHLGSNFESYARVRIRGAIFDELRRMDWVPRSIHRKARKVQLAIRELEQRKGRAPTPAEVSVELKMSLADYHRLLDQVRPATFVCLDGASNPDSDDSPSNYEALADGNQRDPLEEVARRETAVQLAGLLDRLPRAQKKVLALYYYEDMRLREIAEVFGLTESRICQIHAQAILTLKAQLKNGHPGQN